MKKNGERGERVHQTDCQNHLDQNEQREECKTRWEGLMVE